MHLGLKRNFQVMPGAQWLEMLLRHGPMRIIALINDPPVVRRILEHLGLWQPQATERSPPVPPEASRSAGVLNPAQVRPFVAVPGLRYCQSFGIRGKLPSISILRARRWAHERCDRRVCGRKAGSIFLSVQGIGVIDTELALQSAKKLSPPKKR